MLFNNISLTILFATWTCSLLGQADYTQYFDTLALEGSTTIFDYKNQQWIFTDEKDADVQTLPASTFKIPNSLIALEYQAVQDEHELFQWDSIPKLHLGREIRAWNRDTDLKTAYKYSTVWVYVEVAERVGRKRYKKVLRKCKYGNGDLSEVGTDFWNYGDFAISPRAQIDFLVKLYEGRLPFSKTNLEKVKKIMIAEQTDTHTYRAKSGWARKEGKDIGWWVGYLETKDNVYFFATRLIKKEDEENPSFLSGRKSITKQILHQLQTN